MSELLKEDLGTKKYRCAKKAEVIDDLSDSLFFYYRRNELKDEWEMIKWKHQAFKKEKLKDCLGMVVGESGVQLIV